MAIASPSDQSCPEQGGALMRALLLCILLVVCGGVGYKMGPRYYYYLDLRNHLAQVIPEGAVSSDEELRRRLLPVIKRLGISAEGRDVAIQRMDPTMRIEVPYKERLEIAVFGRRLTLWEFDLVASAEGRYR